MSDLWLSAQNIKQLTYSDYFAIPLIASGLQLFLHTLLGFPVSDPQTVCKERYWNERLSGDWCFLVSQGTTVDMRKNVQQCSLSNVLQLPYYVPFLNSRFSQVTYYIYRLKRTISITCNIVQWYYFWLRNFLRRSIWFI